MDEDPLNIKLSSGENLQSNLECSLQTTITKHKTNNGIANNNKQQFQCSTCQATFKSEKVFNRHKINKHKFEESHECTHCKESFRDIDLLYEHLKKHASDTQGTGDILQCLVCSKVFDSNSMLNMHMSVQHKGLKPYRCEYCAKLFSQTGSLDVHQQIHHLASSCPYLCVLCTVRFEERSQLIDHMGDVHQKKLRCSHCVKCFVHSSELRKHERTHTMDRPYECDTCNESFSLNSSLQLHKNKVHDKLQSDRLLFQCALCNQTFGQSSQLNTHILSHLDETPFECPDCAELFAELDIFQEHMKFHDEAPPIDSENVNELKKIDDNPIDVGGESDSESFNDLFYEPNGTMEQPSPTLNANVSTNLTHSIENDLAKLGVIISYNCPLCNEKFNEITEFNNHTKTHSRECMPDNSNESIKSQPEKPLPEENKAIPLPMTTSTIATLSADKKPLVRKTRASGSLEWQKKDNKIRNYKCKICNRSYTLASTLTLHNRRTHLGIKPYECKICSWRFAQSSDLTKHLRKHTGERPYKCSSCNMGFTQNRNLKNHMKMHTDAPSTCKYCNKQFLIDTSLTQHLKKHEGPNTKECSICQIPFTDESDLLCHVRRMHRDRKPHKCDECNKTFPKKCDLKKHQRKHTGERPYECQICHKTFSHPTSLRNHGAVHTGAKPYQCSFCGQGFAFYGNLKVHIRSHTGERPYACSICQKRFARSANLNEHMHIHTGEKAFKCDVCDKAFTNSSTCSKHKKIHSGEKPHKCTLCDKSFVQMAHLTKHIRIHTGERPYECTDCRKTFRRSDTLAKHIKKHQKETLPPPQSEMEQVNNGRDRKLTENKYKHSGVNYPKPSIEYSHVQSIGTTSKPITRIILAKRVVDKQAQIMYTIETPDTIDQVASNGNCELSRNERHATSVSSHFVITQL